MEPREFLALRENWQAEANRQGTKSENIFRQAMDIIVSREKFGIYEICTKPKNLKMYGKHKRTGKLLGPEPDFSITNRDTNRTIFVEVKRQNPAGNAHERACKYLAPGLIIGARERGNIREEHLPFFLVFTEGLVTDERFRSEITFWFSAPETENNFLLWDYNATDSFDVVRDFFQKNIRPVID